LEVDVLTLLSGDEGAKSRPVCEDPWWSSASLPRVTTNGGAHGVFWFELWGREWARVRGPRVDRCGGTSQLLVAVAAPRHRVDFRVARHPAVQPRFDHDGQRDPRDHVRCGGRPAVRPHGDR